MNAAEAQNGVTFNLDDEQEVACIGEGIRNGAYGSAAEYFHKMLEGHPQRACGALALSEYYHLRLAAMEARLAGYIAEAMRCEQRMEAIYATRIPRDLRW